MTDPYSVLGVSPSDTDDQIKNAYKALAKKYHPDRYHDNPLSDLASEKMKEINQAYDEIMALRRGNGSSQGRSSYPAGNSQYGDIRSMINSGRINDAEQILDGVPQNRRDAEWFFLKGSVLYRRGWLEDAYKHFSTACRMDPGNTEYRGALTQMSWQRNPRRSGYGTAHGFGGYRAPGSGHGCSGCDICTSLICADCCCECMGGDLISCC